MSDYIIKKWRRDCEFEKNRGGLRVGMPHIHVQCSDAERMCLEVEFLRAEVERLTQERNQTIERCAEVCDIHGESSGRYCAKVIRALKEDK